ncbi:MAG: amino acid ABC transporter permease [Vulcanimicrobiaceae bacterium]
MSRLPVLHAPSGALLAHRQDPVARAVGRLRIDWRLVCAALVFTVASAAVAQTQTLPADPGVVAVLLKWSPLILRAFVFNIAISFLAMAIGTVVGTLVGIGQISPNRAIAGTAYQFTHFFRNAPWLVLLFFCMFLIPFQFRTPFGVVPFPDWIKAVVGLSLPVMANVSEIVRGGILSIPKTQWEAAASLGFSRRQTLRSVILPQCVKRMLPPWMNLYAILTMATTLASVVGVNEVLTTTKSALNAESRPELLVPFYAYVLLLFFIYCYPISRWTAALERQFAVNE